VNFIEGERWIVGIGHVLDALREMPEQSVQTVVTSPPYYGLRAYGTNPQVWGGDPACAHESSTDVFCQRCNAWRGEFGAEPTPDLYIEHLVVICREIRRVLRDDGTFWLNLGSSYARSPGKGQHRPGDGTSGKHAAVYTAGGGRSAVDTDTGYSDKQLIPIPWLAGIALQRDGWILRNDCIWSKADDDGGTCRPFPAVDRFVPSHEYVLLFAKQGRYVFDWYAVASAGSRHHADNGAVGGKKHAPTRRARTVWTINVRPFKGAHFATFPAELAARCIAAGAPEGGACAACGKARKRVIVKGTEPDMDQRRANGADANGEYHGQALKNYEGSGAQNASDVKRRVLAGQVGIADTRFEPACECNAATIPCTVLDPFSGSGTTIAAAVVMGRAGIGVEMLGANAAMTEGRVADLVKRGFKESRIDDSVAVEDVA
jgi:DNA modification methylase